MERINNLFAEFARKRAIEDAEIEQPTLRNRALLAEYLKPTEVSNLKALGFRFVAADSNEPHMVLFNDELIWLIGVDPQTGSFIATDRDNTEFHRSREFADFMTPLVEKLADIDADNKRN